MLYDVLKSLIEKGKYEYEKMAEDLSLFQTFDVITTEQYIELMGMIREGK